jgi:Bacterial Ig-like domain (group 3)
MSTPNRDRATNSLSNPASRLAKPSGVRSASPPNIVPPREPDASASDKTPTRRGRRTRRPESFLSRHRFRPQVGLLEQRALLTQINLNPYVNSNLQSYANGLDFPTGGSSLTVGGIGFTLANYSGGGTGIIQTPSQANASSFDVKVNVANPNTVYTLINSTYGEYGDTVGAVEFKATGGLDYTVNLVEGQDIRDYNNYTYNNTNGQGALGGIYLGSASFGGGVVRLDKLGFTLPSGFQSATLTDVILHGYGSIPDGNPWLAAATVATGSSVAAPTQTSIRASTASAAVGQSVTFTATVSDLTDGGDIPNGGTVSFGDTNGVIGTATMIDGVAEFTTTGLAAGTVNVSASYSGDANFGASATGTITTVAGNGIAGYKGNGGLATAAELNAPWGSVFDAAGDLFIADGNNNVIREVVKATGDIVVVAGDAVAGFSGDGGLATAAKLDNPNSVAVDSAGDLFISDEDNNRIREVVKSSGDIITIAGTGVAGYSGDNGLATLAKIDSPRGLSVDSSGDVFYADAIQNRVREIVAATGDIITVAGTGTAGFSGDNGLATAAKINTPRFVGVDAAGDLFIADNVNNRVREVVKASGDIITIAGTGGAGFSGDGGLATAAKLDLPNGIAVDSAGDVFFGDTGNYRVREVVKATGDIITVAGDGIDGYSGDHGPATAAELNSVGRLSIDPAGDLFLTDQGDDVIREVTPGVSVTVSGSQTLQTVISVSVSTSTVGINQSVTFTATVTNLSAGGTVPNGGTVFFYDQNGEIGTATLVDGEAILTVSNLGAGTFTVTVSYNGTTSYGSSGAETIITAVGIGAPGYEGDNGPASAAELDGPSGMAFDSAGDLFFTDNFNNVVREVVKATGDVITVAGNGLAGYSGDGGPATAAELYGPDGVAVDSAGDLFIADAKNNVVREVVQATGDIITVAGDGTAGYSGDNGLATAAELNNPRTVAVDSVGDLFIADRGNSVIREVVKATGDIITVAGTGTAGYSGDNGPATGAELNHPFYVALDSAGDLFIADTGNNRIREVIKSSGDIITFAGNGTAAANGDGGPATAAGVGDPHGLAFDAAGDLFIAEQSYNVVREVVKATGDVITVAGNGLAGYSGDGGPATAAELDNPYRVAVDSAGDLFIADGYNQVIREVTPGVTVTISTKYAATINWPAPSIIFGNGLGNNQLDATASLNGSNVPGTFTYFPQLGTILGAGTYTITVTFNPTDTADYLPVSSQTTLIVNPATPTINWPAPVAITYGTALSATQLDATALIPGTFVYTPAAGTVLLAGQSQTLLVTFTPTDLIDYVSVTFTEVINVLKATPTVTWANPAAIVYGTALSAKQLDATASVPGTFAYMPASGSIPNAGLSQTLSVTFTPTDTTDYSSVVRTVAINVLIPTSASVSIPSTTATLHQSITLSVTVSAPAGFAVPVGSIMFFDGATPLGPATLNASGKASLVVSTLGLGQHSITASYAGNSSDVATTSTATPLYVTDLVKEDFLGDGKDDLTYFGIIPGTGGLYGFTTLTAASGFNPAKAIVWDNNGHGFGNSASIPVPADYFGDGRAAYAVWQPDGHGYMELYAISSVNPAHGIAVDFGLTTDLPVVGDVDGDGKADFGVYGYYPGVGYRFDFLLSSRTSTAYPFGFDPNQRFIFDNYGHGAVYGSPTATPVVADFDGSGHAGLGVYLPTGTTSTFYYDNFAIPKGTGFVVDPPETFTMVRTFGYSTDVPMAVDYDGDGRADLAVYGLNPITGTYRYDVLLSSTNFNTSEDVYFDNNSAYGYGYSASIPIMADYEGTGHDDFGVYQPDGKGGATFYYQIRANNQGKVYDVVPSSVDLPVSGPTYLLARRVRGQ